MTELDRLRRIIEADPYARLLGIELLELRPGYSRMAMRLGEAMTNFHGTPHGGAIFSLADAAFAAAANSHGDMAVALAMSIHFLSAPAPGTRLIAEGREQRRGHQAGFYLIEVRTEAGVAVASCQAVVHRRGRPVADSPVI